MLGPNPLELRESDDGAADAVWQADLIRIALRQKFEAGSIDAELVADRQFDSSQLVRTHEMRHQCFDREPRTRPDHGIKAPIEQSFGMSEFVHSDHAA
jgi:hypothetical protein